MRISDWSSDVCSSDLGLRIIGDQEVELAPERALEFRPGHAALAAAQMVGDEDQAGLRGQQVDLSLGTNGVAQAGQAEVGDRKSVVEGKSVSVRVDLGGRRIIKKKNNNTKQHNK